MPGSHDKEGLMPNFDACGAPDKYHLSVLLTARRDTFWPAELESPVLVGCVLLFGQDRLAWVPRKPSPHASWIRPTFLWTSSYLPTPPLGQDIPLDLIGPFPKVLSCFSRARLIA